MRPVHEAIGFMPEDCAISGWAAAYLHGARELDGRRCARPASKIVADLKLASRPLPVTRFGLVRLWQDAPPREPSRGGGGRR